MQPKPDATQREASYFQPSLESQLQPLGLINLTDSRAKKFNFQHSASDLWIFVMEEEKVLRWGEVDKFFSEKGQMEKGQMALQATQSLVLTQFCLPLWKQSQRVHRWMSMAVVPCNLIYQNRQDRHQIWPLGQSLLNSAIEDMASDSLSSAHYRSKQRDIIQLCIIYRHSVVSTHLY